jgi:hypothetical protein
VLGERAVNSGLRLPFTPDPPMVEPLPGAPLKPEPVDARWKAWRGLDVRDSPRAEDQAAPLGASRRGPGMTLSEVVTVPVDDEEVG